MKYMARHQRPHRRVSRLGKKFKAGKGKGYTIAGQYNYATPTRYFNVSKKDVFSGKMSLTERDVNLLKRRLNDGSLKITQVHFPEDGFRLTKDQNDKGYRWLMNLWKSPTGRERSNSPYGYRETDILEKFEEIRLIDFYDAGNYIFHFYVPFYEVIGNNNGFQYAVYGGKINILG